VAVPDPPWLFLGQSRADPLGYSRTKITPDAIYELKFARPPWLFLGQIFAPLIRAHCTFTQIAFGSKQLDVIVCVGPTKRQGHNVVYVIIVAKWQLAATTQPLLLAV